MTGSDASERTLFKGVSAVSAQVEEKLVVSDFICLLKAHCLAWTLFKAFAFFVECVWACSEGSKKKSEIFKLPPKVIKNVVVAARDVATEAAAKRRMLIKEEYGKKQENISQNTHSPRHRRRHCPWGIISFKFLHFAYSNNLNNVQTHTHIHVS